MCIVEAMKLKTVQLKKVLSTAYVRMTEKSTVTGSLFRIEGTQAQEWLRQSINIISKGNQVRQSCDVTVAVKCPSWGLYSNSNTSPGGHAWTMVQHSLDPRPFWLCEEESGETPCPKVS